jgi:hypothetical protein
VDHRTDNTGWPSDGWPAALAIATGHAIAHQSHNKTLAEFAQGLEAAG